MLSLFRSKKKKQGKIEHNDVFSIVENSSEGIFYLAPDLIYLYINPAFKHITGYNEEDTIGKAHPINKNQEYKEKIEAKCKEMQENGLAELKIFSYKKNGEKYLQKIKYIKREGEKGDFLGCFGFLSDISHEIKVDDLELLIQGIKDERIIFEGIYGRL